MAEQLPLPLPSRSALGREDYYVSPTNAVVLTAIDNWRGWAGSKLVVVGPTGSGKTHLAHVFASLADATVVEPEGLQLGDVDKLATQPIAIDGADKVADEDAFFHFYNLMGERGHPLLLTANSAPSRWNIGLKDLKSRLETISVADLPPPDDALLSAVITKQFSDRGIAPQPALVPYLVARIERSFPAATFIVDALDQLAMTETRPIGVKLAARLLDNIDRGSA